jgi:hypothetical protein
MRSISPRIPFLVIASVITITSFPQSLKGRLTDRKDLPVPYAAVYDETTYVGTTSNADGFYDLKLEPGKHSIVFKAMGYFQVRKQITTADQTITLNIQLDEQAIQVKEVVITPGKEDPAYPIMRKVIGLAPYHLNQVKEYTADVYLRGTIHLISIPKIIAKHTEINGQKNVLKSGDVFLQESINQIQFHAPDKYDQQVISFHSTFPGENEDVNPMGFIRASFYQPKIDEFISPLAPNAFSFYTYRYEGFFDEGKNVIFKIKVTPKRNSQQLMKGYLYVVDKLWCLHSADASVHMFFGDLSYKTIYSPVKSNAWLPISYQFYVNAAIMGIKADYKYASSVKFQQVVLNEKNTVESLRNKEPEMKEEAQKAAATDPKKIKTHQEIEALMTKEELTNRDMVKLANLMAKEAPEDSAREKSLEIKSNEAKVTVEKDALKKDTAYWNSMRPIPLTSVEALIPGVKDSTLVHPKDTIPAGDSASTKKTPKKIARVANFITNGAGFWAFDSTLRINYEGLIGIKKVDFNTVDGFIFRQTFGLEQRIDSVHKLGINPGIAYAFSRERVMWWTDVRYGYSPMRGGQLHFHIGSESADYNSETGINSTINSLASLFFRRNYMKLYQQNQAYLSNYIDLANGLNLSVKVGYLTAQPLSNHSDYSFFYAEEREYSPNVPSDDPEKVARNVYHEEAYWDARLEFTPQYYYRVWGGRKHYQYSKYPTFFLRNRMAIPGIVNSTADYDLLEVGARYKKEWGMMHAFSWNVKGGFFLNHKNLYLMDDKYFNNQYLPIVFGNTEDAFRLIPYYDNSVTQYFGEAHVKFTTPYLLIKYIPFLSNKLWCENLLLNYQKIPEHQYYWEIGYSISQIYMIGSIGIFAGFKGISYQNYGVQVSIDF